MREGAKKLEGEKMMEGKKKREMNGSLEFLTKMRRKQGGEGVNDLRHE